MLYVVAVDGPAASGKSSVAKRVSSALNIPYINTGNMYRAVTYAARQSGLSLNPPEPAALEKLLASITLDYRETAPGTFELFLDNRLCGAEIRTPEVTAAVSTVAAQPVVRRWLVERQRALAERMSLVMEGRDIGTDVFPDAKYKFFLTASPLERARRRLAQDGETFDGATLESVAAEIAARDKMDSERPVSPLRQAPGAILIDSSALTLDQTTTAILDHIR